MNLRKPSALIIAMTQTPLDLIEAAGRTCYKSEDNITSQSHLAFVEMILKRGHDSVLEHASASVRFVCDRGVSHEIVRHRIASYSQESTRYCDYNGGHVEFIIPPWVDIAEGTYEMRNFPAILADNPWFWAMINAENSYKALRKYGWTPEKARSVLPNSLKTELVMTANLREWRHFFKLRTAPAAHPQMREITIPLLEEFMVLVPVVFDDIWDTVSVNYERSKP